jgi:transposase-like protein
MTAMAETPRDLDLMQIMARFATDEAAREYLEAVRWPDGPVCPHCDNKDAKAIYGLAANPAAGIRPGLRECGGCGKTFTVTVGTIFERSHIPLHKWLIAWYMLCASKKGVSAKQIERMLDLNYRSAWFMMHRIRYALRDPVFADKLGGGGGTVEADETYVGGKPRKGTGPHKHGRGTKKVPVVAVLERGGDVRSRKVGNVTSKTLKGVLDEHLDPSANVMTDDWRPYRKAAKGFASHQIVNHSAGEYARGSAHTNTVEGYFSLFKRGLNGTFHHVGHQYIDQYLAEFDFRYNHRKVTDGERTLAALKKVEGKRLMLRRPVSPS